MTVTRLDLERAESERELASLERLRTVLRSLLSRARTGTRPDGSPCWCDEEEMAIEGTAVNEGQEESPTTLSGHTALCREVAEVLR